MIELLVLALSTPVAVQYDVTEIEEIICAREELQVQIEDVEIMQPYPPIQQGVKWYHVQKEYAQSIMVEHITRQNFKF